MPKKNKINYMGPFENWDDRLIGPPPPPNYGDDIVNPNSSGNNKSNFWNKLFSGFGALGMNYINSQSQQAPIIAPPPPEEKNNSTTTIILVVVLVLVVIGIGIFAVKKYK